jgi:hypothetical protein
MGIVEIHLAVKQRTHRSNSEENQRDVCDTEVIDDNGKPADKS